MGCEMADALTNPKPKLNHPQWNASITHLGKRGTSKTVGTDTNSPHLLTRFP